MKYTTLVNKEVKIKERYLEKLELIKTKLVDNTECLIEEKTYNAYVDLKNFLKEKNIEIGLSSAYRSIKDQEDLIEELSKEYDQNYIDKFVAKPGHSEHHTGLAIDIVIIKDDKYTLDINELLKDKDLIKVHGYLKDFGFILRYKKEKEEITMQSYEPWHIRYVGKVISTIIHDNNYCLEEYLTEFKAIIPVNKPEGVTSFDVVNDISHIFGIKRVGHTGTLDPLATGVLVITIGKATKLVELLTSTEKEYIAGVTLGLETDTLDITGTTLQEKEITKINKLNKVLKSFKKTYLQEVPKYSAVKVKGKKLYEYARNNIEIELPKKEVTIKEIELIKEDDKTFTFKTVVSKGTYIRSLIRDIAYQTNNIAVMNSLIRTKQGNFCIKDSYTLEDIRKNNFQLKDIIYSLNYPILEIPSHLEKQINNGTKINNEFNIEDKIIFTKNNQIIAIYQKEENYLKSYRGFI